MKAAPKEIGQADCSEDQGAYGEYEIRECEAEPILKRLLRLVGRLGSLSLDGCPCRTGRARRRTGRRRKSGVDVVGSGS